MNGEIVPETAQQVYLIGSAVSPLVKIGTAQNVASRLRSLQNSSPTPLQVLWQAEGGRDLEAALHEYFEGYRQHGEWFDFGEADPVTLVSAAVHALGDVSDPKPTLGPPVAVPELSGIEVTVMVWNSAVPGAVDRLMLLALADCTMGGGRGWFRISNLARKTQLLPDEVAATVDGLERMGLLCRTDEPHPSGLPGLQGFVIDLPALIEFRLPDRLVVEYLTEAEEQAIFDAEARRVLGISGAEFEARWRSGAYVGPEDPQVTRVAMLLPGEW